MSQGANTQGVWGFEEVGGAAKPGQKAATLYGIRFKNFNGTPKPSTERVSNIDPRGQQLKARVGKWDLPFSFESEMSVDDMVRLRAHMQGYAAITELATGVESWAIRDKLSSDTLATALDWMSIEFDRGEESSSRAQLMLQCALEQWDISVKSGKIVSHKLAGMACQYTQMKDPAITTSTGTFAGAVYVRNNRHDADAIDSTRDILAKCTTLGALGTAKFKFTITGTAYSGAEIGPIVDGVWYDVVYGNGAHASGDPLEPVQIMMTGSGAFAVDDIVTIKALRPKATATYPSRNPLMGVKAVITVDGVPKDVEDFDIAFKRPLKYRRGTASKMPIGILPDGTRSFAIKIKRDYVDSVFYLKMLSASSVTFDVTINGDLISTVAGLSYYEKHQLISANAQVMQAGADIPNDKQLPESIDIVPFWDGTTVDMSETIICTLATLK